MDDKESSKFEPVISVIMPLFNADKYLSESLDSVLNQTFKQFELICIDDFSDDATVKIVRDYQEKDSRISIILNKQHSGAAFSRNTGIKMAKGQFICFLDGDDIFDSNMLELAYLNAKMHKAEIVNFEYKHVLSDDIYKKAYMEHGDEYIQKYCSFCFQVKDIKTCDLLTLKLSPCNKLFSKEFIISNKLEFQSLPSSNDIYFVSIALLLARKIINLNDNRVLLYARDHQGKSRISNNRNPMCGLRAMEKLQKELVKRGVYKDYYQYFYCLAYWRLIYILKQTHNSTIAEEFYIYLKKEGINKLFGSSNSDTLEIDNDIKKRLLNFELYNFKSGWFEKEDIFEFFLEKNKELIKKCFLGYKERNMPIGIWGAGKNGHLFLEFCNMHNLEVSAVIDTNKRKSSQVICGHAICLPEEVINSLKVIIVIPQFIKSEVYRQIENRRIEIIDINEFMCLV